MKRNFFHRYLSAKVLPIWTILLIDVFIIVISSLLAYALRYDFRSIFLESSTIDKTILWTVVVNLIFFRVFRTYSNVLRFSSFVDIMRIFVSLTVSYALLMITSVLTESYLEFNLAPVSVLFMSYIISFAMMACSRVVVKTFFEALNFDGTTVPMCLFTVPRKPGSTLPRLCVSICATTTVCADSLQTNLSLSIR